MKVFKIVLTGGPCAGKTTILNAIKNDLSNKNIPCLIIPEAATELIMEGIKPNEWNTFDFQCLVLRRQLMKEEEIANYITEFGDKKDKCVVIYDRSIFDNKAYLSDNDEFRRLLFKYNINGMMMLDSYDLVLDLLSVATCKREAYNLDNDARSESVDLASELDIKTANAWANHRNMKVLSSSISIEEETQFVLDIIHNLINEYNVTSVHRYLVDEDNSNLGIYDKLEHVDINDTYINLGYDNYTFKLSERIGFGESYIFEAYRQVGDKRVILLSHCIDECTFHKLYFNCRHLKYESRKEIGFVDNETLYKLNFFNGRTVLDVYGNVVNRDIRIPNDIIVKEALEDDELRLTSDDKTNIEHIKKLLI